MARCWIDSRVQIGSPVPIASLKPALDRMLHESFNYPDSATDPIQIVRRYHDARTIARSSRSVPRRSRSAGCRASCTRSSACWPSWVRRARRLRPAVRTRLSWRRVCRHRASVDARAGSMVSLLLFFWLVRQMLDRSRIAGGVFSAEADDGRRRKTLAPRSTASRRARWRSILTAAQTARCRRGPASVISSRGRRPGARASASTCFCAGWSGPTPWTSGCGQRVSAREAHRAARHAS